MSSAAVETLFTDDAAVARRPAPGANGASPIRSADGQDPFLARLDRMSPRQRVAEYRGGGFTRQERTVWACRYPEEVPVVNGEVEWIALASADLD